VQASSGPRFLNDFFELFSKFVKKTKPESPAVVWEICDVRQRHIKIWCSAEIKVDHFRGCTGPRSQSVDETRVALTNASRPGLPGESSYLCAKRSLRWDWQIKTLEILFSFFSRKVITFCEEDLRVWTGPVRLGSLTHDSEAAPKVTPL